ncbi:hypothetical protein HG536_0H03750 [Torulaspora globosa]|uniref:CBS domain-containing protein n=1 Tax=Torulaspora globosa TaxID=48254 RepID=A0A7G3ZNB3_9SACH|nr:uncharacterized protein HG536_0H03750 [Torulaspora globosa]QLL34999.1 hypothetical protein HG536_0H03750 [Torulaspora globosa]
MSGTSGSNGPSGSSCSPNLTASRHASIVEMLSTPPHLPHHHQRQPQHEQQKGEGAEGLARTTSIGSSHSSVSSISGSSRDHETQTGSECESVGMGPTASQCLYTVHHQEWQHIRLSELVEQNKLVTVPGSMSVEEAFNTMIRHHLTSLPVEQYPGDMNCLTFDYNDLNSYLLVVLNKIRVNDRAIQQDCQNGKPVPVGEIVKLTPKNPFYKLAETENLSTVMGILGSGVHRVAITNVEMSQIKGVLSQRRLIRYLWDNARTFPSLEPLFNTSLQDLKIGVLNSHAKPTSRQSRVISIQGDEPLIMALYKMYQERISSIAVVDRQANLIGNISVTDVKHVTRTSQYPLLHKSCRHFISVILNVRGLEMGKDSFPIFHVYPTSSLARTLAKLVATKSHRLWIVQPPESASSSTSLESLSQGSYASPSAAAGPNTTNTSQSPIISAMEDPPSPHSSAVASNLFEKEYRTGKLIGVVSLTDILGLLARSQTEHKQVDPQSARRQRGSVIS